MRLPLKNKTRTHFFVVITRKSGNGQVKISTTQRGGDVQVSLRRRKEGITHETEPMNKATCPLQ